MISFTINSRSHVLTRAQVERAVAELEPEPIQSLAVEVGGRWWPAKQPFVAALGLKNTDVNSRTALRNLQRLKFRTHDQATQGPLPDLVRGESPSAELGPGEPARVLALSLAVQLGAASNLRADTVIDVADRFVDWLTK